MKTDNLHPIFANIITQAFDKVTFTNSLKEGDLLVNEASGTIVEFIKFHDDDSSRYLFYGKIVECNIPEDIGKIKRNFYTHKFNRPQPKNEVR